MEPGNAWGDTFPYLVFNTQCNADRLNLAHELGHILGMDHDPINTNNGRSEFNPSCPWSYGHRRADSSLAQNKRFRTVMAYWETFPEYVGVPGPPACANNADCQPNDASSTWNLQWTGTGIQPLPLVPGAAAIGVQTPPFLPPGQKQSNAYDTLQRLGQVVAGFRSRPDRIFESDFD